MKQARKIIFIILAILPILPLICQVIGNIGNDTNTNNIYSWGTYIDENGYQYISQPYFEWEISEVEYNGEILEYISIDPSYLENTGIYDKFLWGLYSGEQINTSTFVGAILKTLYKFTYILGLPNTLVWLYVVLYVIYMIFIEIIMFIVDLTMLVPRKIKEWLN